MPEYSRGLWSILLAGVSLLASPAPAQDRTADNAITQAEDAFGFSVGRETIGIYNAGNTRGFSPTAAGNVRIDGLYFDPAFGLQGGLVDSVGIKVGLSAQGYPFAAPSGIVDQTLRRPEKTLGGSIVLGADSWTGHSGEVGASIPLSDTLGVQIGFNGGAQVYPNGTDNRNRTFSAIARWQPVANVEILPFWAEFIDRNDEAGTFYIPAGSYRGIPDRPGDDESPEWADVEFTARNAGVLANASLGANWVARVGAFRSDFISRHAFTMLLADQRPDGTGERLLIADPPSHNRSLSGEARITHSIPDGPRLHVFHASVRRRDARREFGGSDVVSFGIGPVGEQVTDPSPDFDFGEQTRQRVRQTTFGIAYDGRWKDVGEISFGLSRANYEKVTRIPLVEPVTAKSRPWLYNGTAALIVTKSISLYAGYARGLEESGTAPSNADNRNEPLETILTEQKDAGVRIAVAPGINAVAGIFDLTRPYFGFDTDNVFRRVGSVRSRGAEFSVSGKVTPKLNVVLGGVLLRPRVEAGADVQGNIGPKPVGLPTHIVNFNANWESPFPGLQLDIGMAHRGRQPATTDNLVYLPSRFNLNLGGRYGFKLAGQSASLRVQAVNALDNNDFGTAGPGIYAPRNRRQILGFLTVDL